MEELLATLSTRLGRGDFAELWAVVSSLASQIDEIDDLIDLFPLARRLHVVSGGCDPYATA